MRAMELVCDGAVGLDRLGRESIYGREEKRRSEEGNGDIRPAIIGLSFSFFFF